MKQNNFFWMVAALFLVGCAAAPPAIERQEVAARATKEAAETPAATPRLFEERELLLDGVKLLNLPDRPESSKARPIFISLIQLYPQSRWRPAAEAFIRLIDEREAFRLLADKAKAERGKALQENEALRKTVRELTERLQTETKALAQENEQLKQDIQRLKVLEVELEKRERKLR